MLSGCQLTDNGALALAEGLIRNKHCNLTSLDVSNTGLNVRGLEALCTTACELKTLKVLSFANNSLPRQAGVVVGRAMRLRHGLPGIDCSGNDFGDLGASAIGGSMAAVTNTWRMTMLDLSHNSIDFDGFEKLCEGLKSCHR